MKIIKRVSLPFACLTVLFLLISNNATALQVFSIGADVKGYKFTLLNGEKIKLSDYTGRKCLIIEFWADYCESCTNTMKVLQRFKEENRFPDVEYLGLVCEWGVPMNRAKTYVKKNGITFPQIWIAKKSEHFKVSKDEKKTTSLTEYSLPKRVLIDKTGHIIIENREKFDDESNIIKWLDSVLSECSKTEEHML